MMNIRNFAAPTFLSFLVTSAVFAAAPVVGAGHGASVPDQRMHFDIGEFVATRLLEELVKAETLDDVPGLVPMQKSDVALAKAAIAQMKQKRQIPSVLRLKNPSQIEIVFTDKSYILDLSGFSKKKITLNGTDIALKSGMTFLNYKNIVEEILRYQRSAAAAILDLFGGSAAEAQSALSSDVDFSRKLYLATAITSTATLAQTDLQSTDDIESAWIAAYRGDVEHRAADIETTVFSCDGGHLKMLSSSTIVKGGIKVNLASLPAEGDDMIEFLPKGVAPTAFANTRMSKRVAIEQGFRLDGGYYFKSRECGTDKADLLGKIYERSDSSVSSEKCPDMERNLFQGPPFYNLPKFATLCCQKPGCPEQIRLELEAEQRNHAYGVDQFGEGARSSQ